MFIRGVRGTGSFEDALQKLRLLEVEQNVTGLLHELDNPLRKRLITIAGEAAAALARLGDERAVPALVSLSTNGPEGTRIDAIGALKAFGADPDVICRLREALGDPSRLVRMAAAQALGQLRARQARDDLVRSFAVDADRWVQLYAAEALAELGYVDAEAIASRLAQEPRWTFDGRGRKRRWRRLLRRADGLAVNAA